MLHIALAVRLKLRSVAARPVVYHFHRYAQATFASRTMIWTGIVVGLFTLFHLAHFTFGWVNGVEVEPGKVVPYLELRDTKDPLKQDVYSMVVAAFTTPWLAILYLAAQIALFIHLMHGVQSAFQTLGLKNRRFARAIWWFGFLIALTVLAGNVLIVVGVWAGWRHRFMGRTSMILDPKVPAGPLAEKWSRYKRDQKLINPANKSKYTIIVVGTGLAGASAAASLAELGYKVRCFCFQDSPRRAHSIAAQGGINAAKNYRNDGDCGLPPLLRHHQGRRLPQPRSQRAPARRGLGQHHRPVRGAGRAVRARIWRTARYAFVRRRATSTDVLLSRPNWPATAPGGVSGTVPANRGWHRDDVPALRDARPRRDRWEGSRNRHARIS